MVLLDNIKNIQIKTNIQVQIHTKDLKVFVRSWEDKDIGLNLENFRKGLVKAKKDKRAFCFKNELGKKI